MQITPDLNGDGGRHKAQLETDREREREVVGSVEGEGKEEKKTLAA